MRILFRVDADRTVGTGHIFRCMHIADYFNSKGWHTDFLINDYRFTEEVLRHYNYQKISFISLTQEIEQTRLFFRQGDFDFIVVDFYDKCENASLMDVFANHATRALVAITDDYRMVDIKCDVLIATHPMQTMYDYSAKKQRVIAGERYFIISDEFVGRSVNLKKDVEELLISFGGHDPYDMTGKTAQYIVGDLALSRINLNFLLGGIYRNEQEIRHFMAQSNMKFEFHKCLPSLLPLFTKTDMAITAGGNTMYELCSMGVPSIVVGLNERQHEACKLLAERNLIEYAGYYTDLNATGFNKIFSDLVYSYENRMMLHENCIKHFNINPLEELYLAMGSVKTGGKDES